LDRFGVAEVKSKGFKMAQAQIPPKQQPVKPTDGNPKPDKR
jgi:hypothetical protein